MSKSKHLYLVVYRGEGNCVYGKTCPGSRDWVYLLTVH